MSLDLRHNIDIMQPTCNANILSRRDGSNGAIRSLCFHSRLWNWRNGERLLWERRLLHVCIKLYIHVENIHDSERYLIRINKTTLHVQRRGVRAGALGYRARGAHWDIGRGAGYKRGWLDYVFMSTNPTLLRASRRFAAAADWVCGEWAGG